jgi:hypothetical protein
MRHVRAGWLQFALIGLTVSYSGWLCLQVGGVDSIDFFASGLPHRELEDPRVDDRGGDRKLGRGFSDNGPQFVVKDLTEIIGSRE